MHEEPSGRLILKDMPPCGPQTSNSFALRANTDSSLASASINSTSRAHRLRPGLQTHIFGVQRHRPVFQDVARNAHIADGLGLIKGRMGISQVQELLQVPHMLADVNDFKIGIALNLLFHILAVGAGMHDEHFNHFAVFGGKYRDIFVFYDLAPGFCSRNLAFLPFLPDLALRLT